MNVISAYDDIGIGLPQETVLGPVLFLIYMNDINPIAKSKVVCCADDTSFFISENHEKMFSQF